MRVVYEGAVFEIMRTGGAARYFIDIINRMPAPAQPVVMAPLNVDLPLTHPRLEVAGVRTRPPLKLIRRLWRQMQHSRLENQTASLGGDLVHWTYYVGLCRRAIRRGKLPNVITVLDFIHEAFPELDPGGENRHWQRQAIEAADHICCISETTHTEFCQRYPQAADRASVTMLGNSFASVEPQPVAPPLTNRPFVLFVGRRGGYKNFRVVWEAWNRARQRDADLALVVVGPPMKTRERSQLGMLHAPEGLFHLGAVTDRELKGLYQACRAFVFPSKMEGFGLPALEAMESETAVIASSCAALREVLQSAGHYFDAEDVDTLTDLITAAGRDALADREHKIQLGRQRAAKLSWEQTAQQTFQAYQQLLANDSHRRAA